VSEYLAVAALLQEAVDAEILEIKEPGTVKE
jgi:hypothetical protein